ncbi:MAG: hypothetical protein JSR65_06620 [Proteobacteria bacterium]|nr:hypothetical protein [Pseudomonadota bacterium]
MNWAKQAQQTRVAAQVKAPWEDCDRIRKPFYKPIDIAIRWCGLTGEEATILPQISEAWRVQKGELIHYPCLAVHSEAVEAAMELGKLPYGRDGHKVTDHVARPRRTIAHADLKEWIRSEYPADARKQHMAWLFDDVERATHDAITVDAYKSLEAERDTLKREIELLKQQAPRAPQADSDARLKVIAGLVEASGLNIRMTTAAAIRSKLEQTGYAVSADVCERILSTVRGRLPDWTE